LLEVAWKSVKFPSKKQKNILDTGFRRYDESKENEFQLPFLGLRTNLNSWIPAFAGMTGTFCLTNQSLI